MKRVFVMFALALTMIAMAGGPIGVSRGQPGLLAAIGAKQVEQPAPAAPQTPQMMMMHQRMMAEMKGADARLDQLVAEMNAANGDARVDAIVRVVTELAARQKAMHGRMEMMHEHMMGGKGDVKH